jgi:hypothetical protein
MGWPAIICLLIVALLFIVVISKKKHRQNLSLSNHNFQFNTNKKLWYKSTSASLEDIWLDRLEGDNPFSPYNTNYYINVAVYRPCFETQ